MLIVRFLSPLHSNVMFQPAMSERPSTHLCSLCQGTKVLVAADIVVAPSLSYLMNERRL
jgi:hypothetical protein